MRFPLNSPLRLSYALLWLLAACAASAENGAPVLSTSTTAASLDALLPPLAEQIPKTFEEHGQKREDPYFWLRERENPKVIAYLEAENKYTEAMMKPAEGLRNAIYSEMRARVQENDESVPYRSGDYEYFHREQAGKEYFIHYRRKLQKGAPEELVLDENELATGSQYFSLGDLAPSPDGKLLAYTVDLVGDELYALLVRDLSTGKDLVDKIPKTSGNFVWGAGGKSLYYTTLDATNRPYKTHRHDIGALADKDTEIYTETDERFYITLSKSRSKRFVLMNLASQVTTETHLLDLNVPNAKLNIFEPRKTNVEYYLEHTGDKWFIATNDGGAENFKVMETPIAKPGRKNWKEVIAHRPEVLISSIDAFKDYLVVWEREEGMQHLRIRDFKTKTDHRVAFQEESYSIWSNNNRELNSNLFRFSYTSLTTPDSIFDYDVSARTLTLRKEQPVVGYDKTAYETKRISATSKDGAKIPVTIAYKKTTALDGTAPGMLYGYGAYGSSADPWFRRSWVSLLDRGFVVAVAHIRGGSELGRQWWEKGKLQHKTNSFYDFIGAGEALLADKYVAKNKLTIFGRSAGGLLISAAVNMRPELFRAAIADVPFVDVIGTMMDASLPLTANEWEEWGDPRKPEDYAWMRAYSPYDNVEKKAYPALLIGAGLNDRRVSYWEPAKLAARLRTMKTDSNLLLLRSNMSSGHAGATGRYAELEEEAFYYAFLIYALQG
jgi:oligopeptidase B